MGESFHDAIVREVSAWPGVTTGRTGWAAPSSDTGGESSGICTAAGSPIYRFRCSCGRLVAAGRAERITSIRSPAG